MNAISTELDKKVKELRELRLMAEELQAEIDSLTDDIKTIMTEQDTDTLKGADWKVTWKAYKRTGVDFAALRTELPDVAERFSKTTTYKRFSVS